MALVKKRKNPGKDIFSCHDWPLKLVYIPFRKNSLKFRRGLAYKELTVTLTYIFYLLLTHCESELKMNNKNVKTTQGFEPLNLRLNV